MSSIIQWTPPQQSYILSAITYETVVSGDTFTDGKMFSFPMGIRDIKEKQIVSGDTLTNWLYYTVDLIGGNDYPEYRDYCHKEPHYPQWLGREEYGVGDKVFNLGYDYECLVDLSRIYNKEPQYYPLWWRLLTGGTSQVYMPIGSYIQEVAPIGSSGHTFSLISSGATIIETDIHRDGLLIRHYIYPVYYSMSYTGVTGTEYSMNKDPFYVYRKEKCDKYGKWQLFWLNPHGGFDNFTFDKKVDIDYKIEKTTFKQRLPVGNPTSFDPYFGGTKPFNTNVEEIITLRTNLVTQRESQLIVQLCQSPVVYVLKEYCYDTTNPDNVYRYGLPYTVVSNEVHYEQKRNTKEIFYEIKIKSSNDRVIQSY